MTQSWGVPLLKHELKLTNNKRSAKFWIERKSLGGTSNHYCLKKSCGFDIVINIRLSLRLRSVEVTQIDRRVEFWNVQNQLSSVY